MGKALVQSLEPQEVTKYNLKELLKHTLAKTILKNLFAKICSMSRR